MAERVPKYQQVIADIEARIGKGDLRPGQKLPTTDEMAAHYRVSTQVIEAAMQILRVQGVIVTVQGGGRYVPPGPNGVPG